MKLETVRTAILHWARDQGILSNTARPDRLEAGDKSIVPFSDEQMEYFRFRKIMRILERGGKLLTIFTRQKIADKKQVELQQTFKKAFEKQGFLLEIRTSRPFRIDQRLQTYGRFEPVRRNRNAICCGSSIGVGNQRNAGTFTALVKRKGKGDLYGLGCNHVIGGCSTALPGTPIVVPGIQDVSADIAEINLIGEFDSAATMSQGLPSLIDTSANRDIAWFGILDQKKVSSRQGAGPNAFDTPTKFATPKVDMPLKKWGRSTGFTQGVIETIHRKPEWIDYSIVSYYGPANSQDFKGTVYFEGVIEVSSLGRPFSLGGDSGSLVVTDYPNKADRVVGILIGGNREKSFVLPLEKTLKDLEFKLVSDHNVS